MKLENISKKKGIFFQLRKKFKRPPFYSGWAQTLQAFRLIFILSKLSVIGYFGNYYIARSVKVTPTKMNETK